MLQTPRVGDIQQQVRVAFRSRGQNNLLLVAARKSLGPPVWGWGGARRNVPSFRTVSAYRRVVHQQTAR